MGYRNLIFFSITLFVCEGISAHNLFRFDYEYYPAIDGWLKLHLIPATWRDAWLRCELEGSVLASPVDANMILAMESHWKGMNATPCAFYTGIHATFSKGDFSTIQGVPLAKLPVRWADGEPDNANNSENCIVFTDGTIADVNCSDLYAYMCYREKTKDMVMTSCGTVDKEYEMNAVTGKCYKFHREAQTWPRAHMTCAAEGGHLAIINSRDEALFLKNMFDKHFKEILPGANNTEILLIGMHDWGQQPVWRTIHGVKIKDAGYADWHEGQPESILTSCGAMFRSSAKLDDFFCDRSATFICEKDKDSLYPTRTSSIEVTQESLEREGIENWIKQVLRKDVGDANL